jgi:hypothetical protein
MQEALTLTISRNDHGEPCFNNAEVRRHHVDPTPEVGLVGNELRVTIDCRGPLPVTAIVAYHGSCPADTYPCIIHGCCVEVAIPNTGETVKTISFVFASAA